jgi:hypothetical protein
MADFDPSEVTIYVNEFKIYLDSLQKVRDFLAKNVMRWTPGAEESVWLDRDGKVAVKLWDPIRDSNHAMMLVRQLQSEEFAVTMIDSTGPPWNVTLAHYKWEGSGKADRLEEAICRAVVSVYGYSFPESPKAPTPM